jgi:hypothetical protein
MNSEEAEQTTRQLCRRWADELGITISAERQPKFSEFYFWLQKHHSARLEFLSRLGVAYMIETWFHREFNQPPLN